MMQPTVASLASIMPIVTTDTPDTIAIIDDDPLMRRTMAANLEDAGFRPAPFDGGRAALDYFSGGGLAAAILLDWQMPDVDGPEVLRQLRANGHQVPVIFLTGHNQPIYEEAALAGGAAAAATTEASGITFDNDSARAFWRSRQLDLTLTEFKVVKLLVAKAGRD